MSTVAVIGAAGRLGSRVVTALEAHDHDVIALDVDAPPGVDRLDLLDGDIGAAIEGADVVVHLASAFDGIRDVDESARIDLQSTRRLLAAADESGTRRLVLLSSAMVYGAWPTNPLPMTEKAPIRPNPEFAFATAKAEEERMVNKGRDMSEDHEIVILRPTTAGADGEVSWAAQAIRAAGALGVEGEAPPVQFLHLDDLSDAVVLAVEGPLHGAYNVAPDGWIDAETARALEGSPPRLQVSERLAGSVASFRWRYRLAQTPPGIVPYSMHPWVVANGRIAAAGFTPKYTTEQTIVDTFPAKPWAMMTPKRRQQLALGGVATLVLGASATAAALTRYLRRR
jgi:nucleoside-diphosphate-sugar epimerase